MDSRDKKPAEADHDPLGRVLRRIAGLGGSAAQANLTGGGSLPPASKLQEETREALFRKARLRKAETGLGGTAIKDKQE